MKIIFGAGACILLMFICVGFTVVEVDYQVIPLRKVSLAQKLFPGKVKSGTFLYTNSKQLNEAFTGLTSAEIAGFDFENNRYVHIQYLEQGGCNQEADVIQEIRKYKHYYEVILIPYSNGNCKTKVKPYQVTAIPNDGYPVLITGTLPE